MGFGAESVEWWTRWEAMWHKYTPARRRSVVAYWKDPLTQHTERGSRLNIILFESQLRGFVERV